MFFGHAGALKGVTSRAAMIASVCRSSRPTLSVVTSSNAAAADATDTTAGLATTARDRSTVPASFVA